MSLRRQVTPGPHLSKNNIVTEHVAQRKLPPLPVSKRKLPKLPQGKRKIPRLPQSKSKLISSRSNGPMHSQQVSTHSNSSFGSHLSDMSFGTQSLRNLFQKVQQKMGGSKPKLISHSNTNSTVSITRAMTNDHAHHDSEPMLLNPHQLQIKSKWRPNLDFILEDEELLRQLVIFMTKQYNEENVLFLVSVTTMEDNINELLMFGANVVEEEKINAEISAIFNVFIIHDAEKQINLSSDCFNEVMNQYQKFKDFTLKQKSAMFANCVNEICHLISTSILSWFYQSDEFQRIARSRNIYTNDLKVHHLFSPMRLSQANISDQVDYDSDDVAFDQETESKVEVCFDCHSSQKWTEHNKYMLSSNGFDKNSGYHEWKIKITKTSKKRQEFGVVSTFNKNISMNEFGICDTPMFGARVVYGYNKLIKMDAHKQVSGSEPSFYYASYNKDNSVRCTKDLSSLGMHQRAWRNGDVITICLDLTKGIVKFYLNGKKVRKTISIQRDTIYYPIILYSGKCEYKVIA